MFIVSKVCGVPKGWLFATHHWKRSLARVSVLWLETGQRPDGLAVLFPPASWNECLQKWSLSILILLLWCARPAPPCLAVGRGRRILRYVDFIWSDSFSWDKLGTTSQISFRGCTCNWFATCGWGTESEEKLRPARACYHSVETALVGFGWLIVLDFPSQHLKWIPVSPMPGPIARGRKHGHGAIHTRWALGETVNWVKAHRPSLCWTTSSHALFMTIHDCYRLLPCLLVLSAARGNQWKSPSSSWTDDALVQQVFHLQKIRSHFDPAPLVGCFLDAGVSPAWSRGHEPRLGGVLNWSMLPGTGPKPPQL